MSTLQTPMSTLQAIFNLQPPSVTIFCEFFAERGKRGKTTLHVHHGRERRREFYRVYWNLRKRAALGSYGRPMPTSIGPP